MEEIDIIVIDDDPMAGELTKDLLTDAGYKTLLINESSKAIDAIKTYKPKLVITDIMMPGINGMEICKKIKTSPDIKHIKVIILSGKSYESEKQRALTLGADYFISKPYNVETFSNTIKEILQPKQKNPPPPPPSPSQPKKDTLQENPDINENHIYITSYGIRGLSKQLPTSPSKYGRQTLCFTIETKKDILILDAGSGLYNVGVNLIKNKPFYKTIWLFLTHFHLDNIIGLPHFLPFLESEYTINIVGPNDPEKSFKDVIRTNLYSSFSPIQSKPKAKINLFEVLEENYEISKEIKMATMYSNHPTTTMIYLFNINGFKIAYAPDSEIWEQTTAFQDYNERLGKFTYGFNILLHDAYYDTNDYKDLHHKGHSSIEILTSFAIRNKIKSISPIHINPEYNDERIDKMIESANQIIKDSSSHLRLVIFNEEKTLVFENILQK